MKTKSQKIAKALFFQKHTVLQGLSFIGIGLSVILLNGFPKITPLFFFALGGFFFMIFLLSSWIGNNFEKWSFPKTDEIDRYDETLPVVKRYQNDEIFSMGAAVISVLIGISMTFPKMWISLPALIILVKGLYDEAMRFLDGDNERYFILNIAIGSVILGFDKYSLYESVVINTIFQILFLFGAVLTIAYRAKQLIATYKENKNFSDWQCRKYLTIILLNVGIIMLNVVCHCFLKW